MGEGRPTSLLRYNPPPPRPDEPCYCRYNRARPPRTEYYRNGNGNNRREEERPGTETSTRPEVGLRPAPLLIKGGGSFEFNKDCASLIARWSLAGAFVLALCIFIIIVVHSGRSV
jgi:hypothetical protein